jgi:amidase
MPETITDLETASASTLVSAVEQKRVSALELTDAAIARIEKLNPPLNAVIVKDYDRARDAARAVDARVAKGERAPLMGVPMTVKESHKVAGLPTTWGFEHAKGWIPAHDSTVITRLKQAGAIILGKTNVPPALGDWMSVNPIYGRTNNPHDLSRTPGGSSGGAAAAVASGMVPLEVGTDIGGSIRIPANFCGIYGHKPSFNLVPAFDHSPPEADGAGQNLSVVGPLARTPDDLLRALDVIAGPGGGEEVGYKLALPAPRHTKLSDFRVLVIDQFALAKLDSEVRAAINETAAGLERAGAKVSRASPLLPDLIAAHAAYVRMLGTITSRRSPGEGRVSISAHDWLDLNDEQLRLKRAWRAFFGEFDIVLAPIFGTPAFPHIDEADWGKRTLMIDGQSTPYGAQLAWSGIATFPGLPATAVPIGKTKTGLPIGAQLIGPYLEDYTPLQLARLLHAG